MKNDPNCKLCKLSATAHTVCMLGSGPRKAKVMIIGEAPGREEDERGVPFVGKSGSLLNDLLSIAGLDRDEVFICNAVSCRPPENRTPGKREIAACKKWLDYQIAMVNPRFIVTLGNVPLQSLTGEAGIKKKRGKPFEKDGRIILPMYHPAFGLRDPNQIPLLEADFKLLRQLIEFNGIPEEKELDFIVVDDQRKVERMLADLKGRVACDLETSRLYPFTTDLDLKVLNKTATKNEIKQHKKAHQGRQPQVVSIQFATRKHQWVIPGEEAGVWTREQLIEILDRVTELMDGIILGGHGFKFDLLWLWVRFGVEWKCDFDTMLAHYMLNENERHGLKELAQKFLQVPDWDIEGADKTKWSIKNAKYGAHDAFYTRKLSFIFDRMLREEGDVQRIYELILIPCVKLFVEAEYRGLYIDQSKMDDAEQYLHDELKRTQAALAKYGDINWGSPQQVADLLYRKLKIPVVARTAKGKPSTSESALNQIDHPAVATLLEFRGAKQQLSFFIDGWKPFIDTKGWLHPSFKLHGTVTGRLSAEHPNLQQTPRDPRIRSLITAPPGYTLIELDLSQIELRIAAEMADELNMLQAFNSGIDVHWLTALREIERGGGLKDLVLDTARTWTQDKSLSYSTAIEKLLEMGPDAAVEIRPEWKEFRKKAKAINFGYLYGMWWKKFIIYARDNYSVRVSEREAQDSRKSFFNLYPAFVQWHERQRRFARINGYVRSLAGRKRRLPAATHGQDTPERREAERQAINSPVQSFANELNLMAALQMREEYPRKLSQICATIHDACLFIVRDDVLEKVFLRGQEIMKRPRLLDDFEVQLSVPIEADGKIGPWGTGVSLKKWKEAQRAKHKSEQD